MHHGFVSLDMQVGSVEGSRKLSEIIPDDSIADPSEAMDMVKIEARVRGALRDLTPREEAVLRMRFGLSPNDSDIQFLKGEK